MWCFLFAYHDWHRTNGEPRIRLSRTAAKLHSCGCTHFFAVQRMLSFSERRKQRAKELWWNLEQKRLPWWWWWSVVIAANNWETRKGHVRNVDACECCAMIINRELPSISVTEMPSCKTSLCVRGPNIEDVFFFILLVRRARGVFSDFISCVICLNSSNEINDDLTPAIDDVLMEKGNTKNEGTKSRQKDR